MNLTDKIEDTKESLKEDIENKLLDMYDFPENFQVSLLKYSENIIYKITFDERENTPPVVFRIHRPGYHDKKELESEMIWMEEIERDTDVLLPKVYRGRNGLVIEKMISSKGTEFNCSVISFLNGKILHDLSEEELFPALEEMGEIIAKLHIQAINRDEKVELKRFSWDIHNFFDKDGVWGSWRDYPGLEIKEYKLLEKCQAKITEVLEGYGRTKEHYGLIHGDLHFANVIRNKGENWIFDFDDSAYGFYMYDFGCTLVTYSKNLKELTQAMIQGYEKYRKLSEADKKVISMCVLLRRIVRLAWLASHWDSDTRKTVGKDYVNITIAMAAEWMENFREKSTSVDEYLA
jgi:Ser/Thr protein kinase RdoA (MazF antagonist)